MNGSTSCDDHDRQTQARTSRGRASNQTNRTLAIITDELHAALKGETQNILAIGDLLIEAKAKVDHGEWLPWLKQKFSMSARSAQKYMKAAEFVVKNELGADLNLSPSALYLLSEDTYWKNEDGRTEAAEAVVKAGQTGRVGEDLAKEVIDKVFAEKAKQKAREKAMADARAEDIEKAEREANERGESWADVRDQWIEAWSAKNWDGEREAKFEAEWQQRCERNDAPTSQLNRAPESDSSSAIVANTAKSQQSPTRRPITGSRSTRAAAAGRDARRMDGVDRIKCCIAAIKEIISEPFFEDRDRKMIRHEHTPWLDGFIDEKGKRRFDASQFEAATTTPVTVALHGNDVSNEDSARNRTSYYTQREDAA